MKVLIVGYRQWAVDLAEEVQKGVRRGSDPNVSIDFRRTFKGHPSFEYSGFDLLFFVGWSDMIPEAVYTEKTCLVLHPSPLPRYRGGSPIQHQIIAGESTSAVTIFKLDTDYPGIDSGPIAWMKPFSILGSLQTILERITAIGAEGVLSCIQSDQKDELRFVDQIQKDTKVWRRRTPDESEITQNEIVHLSALQLHNKVRALQAPYPLPYIVAGDKRRLYITQTRVETEEEYAKRTEIPNSPDALFSAADPDVLEQRREAADAQDTAEGRCEEREFTSRARCLGTTGHSGDHQWSEFDKAPSGRESFS